MIKTHAPFQFINRFAGIGGQCVNRGFSLIELLIVLVITGILASLGYPSYQDYIVRAHRTDGQSALLDLACRMESYYADHGTWQTATIGTGKSTDILSQNQSPEGWYSLSLIEVTDTTYTLQATPNPDKFQDERCKSLTLNSSGAKGITDTRMASVSQCW